MRSTRGSARSRRRRERRGAEDLRAEGRGRAASSIRVRARAVAATAVDASRSRAPPASRSHAGPGTGTAVDWTWESAGAPGGLVHVDDRSRQPRVRRPVSLRAGGGTRHSRSRAAAAEPEAISPNGDGQADTATAHVPDLGGRERHGRDHGRDRGRRSRPWSTACGRRPGSTRSTIDGAALADGDYNVVVTARTRGRRRRSRRSSRCSVNRTLGPRDGRAGSRSRPTATGGRIASTADVRARGACRCAYPHRA